MAIVYGNVSVDILPDVYGANRETSIGANHIWGEMSGVGRYVYGRIIYGSICVVWGKTSIHVSKRPWSELSVARKI